MINDAYHLVIDAILGLEADPANVKEPYAGMLVTLKQVKIPIASVDVPSGESGSVVKHLKAWPGSLNPP